MSTEFQIFIRDREVLFGLYTILDFILVFSIINSPHFSPVIPWTWSVFVASSLVAFAAFYIEKWAVGSVTVKSRFSQSRNAMRTLIFSYYMGTDSSKKDMLGEMDRFYEEREMDFFHVLNPRPHSKEQKIRYLGSRLPWWKSFYYSLLTPAKLHHRSIEGTHLEHPLFKSLYFYRYLSDFFVLSSFTLFLIGFFMLLDQGAFIILTLVFVLYLPVVSRIYDLSSLFRSNRIWKVYWEEEREKTIQDFIETNAFSPVTIDKIQQLEVLQKIWIQEAMPSVFSLKNVLMVIGVLMSITIQLLALLEFFV